jgi:hypothetical protein
VPQLTAKKRRCRTYMAAYDLISNAYRCKKSKFIPAGG